ncbi:ATP-binding protein [Thioalkalivibrio paradoxus]|uniref:Molecular chaperone of HSP90 family n=1 Tax=Thioalkalivibrio paradoxus ARh 1 TaxID=713585 RepID=W0DF25_9GAMM|nr:ATP-binding protein [Thioalkalivibrio paradoxus]AHE97219.1 molecular chaperone of HSP90 family [Thioalkalivibrio paradoxus ARh 1]
MSEASEKIPFAVEISRMIEVLAAQIYPTPFALLRENVQNSFDALLLRRHLAPAFTPCINVIIEPRRVVVSDNGIGMSREDLRQHFWRAGSSSKNTPEARAAGVVGTFGIGAMANFGLAEELTVETESGRTAERTLCKAARSTLSVTEDCISFDTLPATGSPGTTVTAIMQPDKLIDVAEAETYIGQFVAYLPIQVEINGRNVSGQLIQESVPSLKATWTWEQNGVDLGGGFKANVELTGALSGEVRIDLQNIESGFQRLPGRMVLRQGEGSLRTFRSGFGLATASVASAYRLGGVADFLFLQPTAGREALTTESLQLLQSLLTHVDEFISLQLANRPESNANSFFVAWAARKRRYDLCGHLRVRIEPGDSVSLSEVRARSEKSPVLVYSGTDSATVKHASEDKPIILLTKVSPRRDCEISYLRHFCKIEELSDDPKVLVISPESEISIAQKALAFRVGSILSGDYFLEAQVRYGTISHGLPVLVTSQEPPIELFLDPQGTTVRLLLELYDREYSAFGHMAKDFVRNMVFPRVSDLVPSATRQGAEAFLKSIHRTREVFEYETNDLESLTSLWTDYLGGKLTFQQATERSTRVAQRSYQVLDRSAAGAVRDVVPDVINNAAATEHLDGPQHGALPPIQRLDMNTDKKLLTIEDGEPPLKGYRCFLAITSRIQEEKGDFFLQPHSTSVVWGGQKALFIFEHHSGDFGLYYDLQTQNLISDISGGGSFETCTIVMKNRIFIPVPPPIQASFLPQENERKRFEVRCDILHTD